MSKNKKAKSGGTKPPKSREQKQAERQALAMWALLGNGGAGFGGAMKPEIKKAEREALLRAGLITEEPRARAKWLEVTDRGWRWAAEHLGDALPDKTYAGAFVLQAWLARLQTFMRARNIELAEVLGPQAARSTEGTDAPTEEKIVDFPTLRERIRKAYLDATSGTFNARALLRDIRKRLPEVNREALDDALKRMQRDEDAHLMQLDNTIEITEADRAAALYIGREPRHILWISR